MRAALIVLGLIALSGCVSVEARMQRQANAAALLVEVYCDRYTSADLREAFLTRVSEATTPHALTITCKP